MRWMLTLVAVALGSLAGSARGDEAGGGGRVTFTEHIAPIVFEQCTSCHRPGQGAPFVLMSYDDVKKRGRLIQRVTEDRIMPPWHPVEGWGTFADERRLTAEQLDQIDRWVESGMEEGPKDRLPPLPQFPDGWQLGRPDLVVTMDEPFDVLADGPDINRNFVIPLNLDHDRWVTAVEIRPSARSVVHHALYFLDETGTARELDRRDPRPGFSGMGYPRTGSLGGWAVGATPRKLPQGLAFFLPKGADLVVQTHFHPSGKPESERTTLGIYFSDVPPAKQLLGTQAPFAFGIGTELRTRGIAPGEKDFTIHGRWEVPFDIDLVSVGGHAHYLCTTMQAVARRPDGQVDKLFFIDRWDFNWQGRYNYADPVRLAKGTVIETTLTYDNSVDNPRNPRVPPVAVWWGRESTDEMGSIGFAFVAADEDDLKRYDGPRTFLASGDRIARAGGFVGLLRRGAGGRLDPRLVLEEFRRRDADGNGRLSGEEVPPRLRPFTERFDLNSDGALDGEEIDVFFRLLGLDEEAGIQPEPAAPGPKLTNPNGKETTPLTVGAGTKARVMIFIRHDCPVANHYAAEIGRLATEYSAKGVAFLLVHVDPALSDEAARGHAREYWLDLPIVIDRRHELVRATGAEVTPEAAVVAPDGTMAYVGRIDDRFAMLGRQRAEPSRRDLRDALDAILAGRAVATPRTEAIGCPIAE